MTQNQDAQASANEIEIHQGSYWRARHDLKKKGASKPFIPAGRVLLLISIRDVDQQAHTIILRGHPDEHREHYGETEYRFLVDEFLDAFEFVPEDEARAIRQKELAGVQAEVEKIQQRIALAAKNPEVMKDHVDAGVKAWEKEQKVKVGSTAALPVPTSADSLALMSLTEQGVDNMKLALSRAGKVADLQGEWMKEQSTALATTIKHMTPFFQESAAAALAKTEDVRLKIDQLYRGIASLDLYVGKNVEVITITTGASADPEIPLTIKQSKLFMDEELSVYVDIGEEFDFRDQKKFFGCLAKNPALADQIFPSVRSVICMAVCRESKFYEGDAWSNAQMNERNKEVFLLVRDGANIHKVWSPIESHLRAGRLFPTRKEIDEIFQEKGWYDFDTKTTPVEQIKFMDVRYTDKLSEHERVALHYKRFLILMAGLDHRLDLFGKFYTEPKGLGFISQRFVSKYMNMIADDEQIDLQLMGEVRPDFAVWIDSRNDYLRSGSRVIGFWVNCMSQESAPGVYEKENWRMREGPRRQYDPVDDFSVQVPFRDGKNIMVKIPVEGETVGEYKKRTFDASVNLSAYKTEYHGFGFLVLDAVKAEELDYYIHSRIERVNHVSYIRLFKHAAQYLRREEEHEKKPRAAMLKALEDGGIAHGDEALEIVDKAVIAYRAAKRGVNLPDIPDRELLDQMFELARGERRIEQAENYAQDRHLIPLRLTVSGKSVLRLYCAPRPEEREDRLFPHAWVKCLTLYPQRRGLGLSNTTWKCLPLKDASETVLKEWPGIEQWAGLTSPVSYADKQKWLGLIDESHDGLTAKIIGERLPSSDWQLRFDTWKHFRRGRQSASRRRVVINPACAIPVGLSYKEGKDGKTPTFRVICFVVGDFADWLYHTAPTPEHKAALLEEYSQVYNLKKNARDRLSECKKSRTLQMIDPADLSDSPGYGILREGIVYQARAEVKDLDKALEEEIKESKRYHSRAIQTVLGRGWAGWRASK